MLPLPQEFDPPQQKSLKYADFIKPAFPIGISPLSFPAGVPPSLREFRPGRGLPNLTPDTLSMYFARVLLALPDK